MWGPWPDGKKTEILNQPSNTSISIDYRDSAPATDSGITHDPPSFFTELNAASILSFYHSENAFIDFEREPRRMLSTAFLSIKLM